MLKLGKNTIKVENPKKRAIERTKKTTVRREKFDLWAKKHSELPRLKAAGLINCQ